MKSCKKITEEVLDKSKEIIIGKMIRRRRIMTAVKASAACLAFAGVFGTSLWIANNSGNISLLPNTPDIKPFVHWNFSSDEPYDEETIYTDMRQTDMPIDTAFTPANGSEVENTDFSGVMNTGTMSTEPAVWEACVPDEFSELPITTVPYDWYDLPSEYHYHEMINCKVAYRDDPEVPPKNGTVYITKEAKQILDFYGEAYRDDCKVAYCAELEYYKDGKPVEPSQELCNSEWERLKDFLNSNAESIPDCFGYSRFVGEHPEWEMNTEPFMYGIIYKSQAENFPANEDYGIVIRVSDRLWGHTIARDN